MGLMKKLTSAIVASSLVLSLVGTAFAAYTPAAGETAGNRMMALKVLNGKTVADPLSLKDEITRAELVTIIVRAFGQEENAKLLVGASAFPDTAKHWASGNIAMAKALVEKQGDSIGMPDGTFAPDAKLTPAQAVAFLMKFLGVKADATKTWPANYLDAAVTAGLIASGDKDIIAPMLNDNATRGLVFYLFDSAFYSYDLGAGKTFYTKYVDTMGPVVTLNAVEKTTLDSKVTISGKAEGAKEVYVGTTAATLAADGTFSADFNLPEMKEYAIAVTARDIAGNATEKAVSITRTIGAVATVEAAAITVAAGATVDVAAVAKDAKGNTVADATITGESTVGTFAAGKFTAGKVAGTGTLTLKSGEKTADVAVTVTAGALANVVTDKASVAPGAIVSLSATDEFGNTITGVTYSQTSADAMLDGVNGKFMASKAGSYTVTAKAGTVEKTVTIGVYDSTLSKYLVSTVTSVIANNATEFEAKINAVDANGNVIANHPSSTFYMTGASFEYYNADTDTWAAFPVGGFTMTKGVKTLKLRTTNATVGGQVVALKASSDAAGNNNKHSVNVELIEQTATAITVTPASKYLANNVGDETVNATFEVVDQAGKPMLSGAYAVKVAISGPATINSAASDGTRTVTFIGGAAAPTVTLTSQRAQSGTVTFTATAGTLTTGTATVTATAYAAVAKFNATLKTEATGKANNNATLAFKVHASDATGIPVNAALPTGADPYLVVDIADDDAADIQVATSSTYYTLSSDLAGLTWNTLSSTVKEVAIPKATTAGFNSTGTTYVYVKAAGYTGNLTVTVKDKATSGALTSVAQTFTFNADAYARFGSNGSVKVPAAAPAGAVSFQLYDGSDNKVAVADVELTVKVYSDAGLATQVTDTVVNGTTVGTDGIKIKTDATGKASLTVSVPGYVGYARYFQVTGFKTDGTTALVDKANTGNAYASSSVSVVNFVANNMTTQITGDSDSVTKVSVDAGTTVRVRATVKDVNGNNVGTGETVKLTVAEGKAQKFNTTTSAWENIGTGSVTMSYHADGYYYADVKPTSAGRVAFAVKDSTYSTEVTASAAIGVRALAVTVANNTANPFRVVVSGAQTSSTGTRTSITKNTPTAYTLTYTDAFGNTVAAPYDVNVTLAAMDGLAADGNVFFRTSETGVNVTTVKIAAGSTSTTIYVLATADANTFELVTSGTSNDTANAAITISARTFYFSEQ